MSDTRKVQKVGGGTYTVSIPKAWASDQDLDAGTEVTLFALDEGSLVVRVRSADDGWLADARVGIPDDRPETVERAFAAAYATGFRTFRLEGSLTAGQRRAAREVARGHAGVQITEEGESGVVVRAVLDPAEVSIQQSVVQLEFVALSMHRAGTAALVGEDDGRRVAERSTEVRRRVAMVRRHLSRALVDVGTTEELGVDRPALFDYYCTARALERVADHAVRLDDLAARGSLSGEHAAAVRDVASDARSVVEDATAALLGGSPTQVARDALDRRDELRHGVRATEAALADGGDPRAARAALAVDCLARTAAAGGDVAETALAAALRADDEKRWSVPESSTTP